jgi:ankyrin repeat protein
LGEAARHGDLATVKKLVQGGASLAPSGRKGGNTPLGLATYNGHKGVVEFLLANGAEVNAKDDDGDMPLHDASGANVESGHREIVVLLLRAGAEVNARDGRGYTPLLKAVVWDRISIVEALLTGRADVNASDELGKTPLHHAAQDGRNLIAEMLLANGAKINASDKYRRTPLHLVAASTWEGKGSGYEKLLGLLLANGADVNALEDENGRTSLHLAAESGELRAVELLLAKGADLDALDKKGKTPPQVAFDESPQARLALSRLGLVEDTWILPSARGKREDSRESSERRAQVSDFLMKKFVARRSAIPSPPPQPASLVRPEPSRSVEGKSDYWKCPKCSSVLKKGFADALAGATVVGSATCAKCGARFDQSAVYGGEFDVGRKYGPSDVLPVYYQVLGNRAFWGGGNDVALNEEYTPLELGWLLDGSLFRVGPILTKETCQELVEGNFAAAFEVAAKSNRNLGKKPPQKSDGYILAIIKLQLSFAIRNSVSFPEVVRAFKNAMK